MITRHAAATSMEERKDATCSPDTRVRLPSRCRPPRARLVISTFLRSQQLSLLLSARLFVLRPVQPLVLRAAVHHGATARAVSELFDRLLRLGAGGEGAVAQPVLGDVGTLPRLEFGAVLLRCCYSSLQRTTRSQHAAHRLGSPFSEHGGTKGGLEILWGQIFCHERHKIGFSNQRCSN